MTSPCPSPTDDLTGFLAWHRSIYGDARMEGDGGAGGDGGDGGGTGGGGAGGGGGAADPPKTYTQAEVDRLTSREKDQGERAGMRKALEQLGVDPDKVKPEDLKARLESAQAAEDAKKDEATRDREAAAADKQAAADERAQVAADRHALAVERALVAAGVPGDDVEDIALLVKAKPGDNADTIKTAVEDLKTKRPALFATSGDSGLPHGDPGGAGGGAGGGGKGKDAQARGKALAAELGWGAKEKQTA